MNPISKILIVDDEETIVSLIEDTLAADPDLACIEILTAFNGIKGLEIFKEKKCDLIITDMKMPIMTGDQFLEEIRKIDKEVDVIVITGYAEIEMAISVMRHGAHAMIRKPFLPDEILHPVKELVEKRNLKNENSYMLNRLVDAERLASIGILSAGVAHEINNPNTFVKGNLELLGKFWKVIEPILQEAKQRPSADQSKIQMILESFNEIVISAIDGTKRIAAIVSGMLTSSRTQVDKRPFLISELIEKALAMLGDKSKGLQIEHCFSKDNSKIAGNQQEILQIIINLLGNAFDALHDRWEKPSEGRVEIIILDNPSTGIQTLTIKDNAGGIPAEKLNQIFNPFYTTKPVGEGTGLGLYISKNFAEKNGGSLSCDSVAGIGSAFVLQLPISDEDVTSIGK